MRNRDSNLSADQDLTVTPQLPAVGNHWRQAKEKNPASLIQPLRTVLLSSWLTAFRLRVQELQTNPKAKERAIASGILENDQILYLQWDLRSPSMSKQNPGPTVFGRLLASSRTTPRPDSASQRGWTLPPLAEAGAGDDIRCHPMDACDPKPNSGSTGDIPAFGQVGPERSHPSCELDPQTLQAREESTGCSGRRDDPRPLRPSKTKLLSPIIPNPSNFSYANSLIFSILWAAQLHRLGHADSWPEDAPISSLAESTAKASAFMANISMALHCRGLGSLIKAA